MRSAEAGLSAELGSFDRFGISGLTALPDLDWNGYPELLVGATGDGTPAATWKQRRGRVPAGQVRPGLQLYS